MGCGGVWCGSVVGCGGVWCGSVVGCGSISGHSYRWRSPQRATAHDTIAR